MSFTDYLPFASAVVMDREIAGHGDEKIHPPIRVHIGHGDASRFILSLHAQNRRGNVLETEDLIVEIYTVGSAIVGDHNVQIPVLIEIRQHET